MVGIRQRKESWIINDRVRRDYAIGQRARGDERLHDGAGSIHTLHRMIEEGTPGIGVVRSDDARRAATRHDIWIVDRVGDDGAHCARLHIEHDAGAGDEMLVARHFRDGAREKRLQICINRYLNGLPRFCADDRAFGADASEHIRLGKQPSVLARKERIVLRLKARKARLFRIVIDPLRVLFRIRDIPDDMPEGRHRIIALHAAVPFLDIFGDDDAVDVGNDAARSEQCPDFERIMRAVGGEGGAIRDLQVPGADDEDEHEKSECAAERAEDAARERLLYPPLETQSIKFRRIRRVEKYLIRSNLRILSPCPPPHHPLMILALTRLRTKNAATVHAAPISVKSGIACACGA